MFDDFERYARVPDEYAAPEIKEYTPTVRQGGGATCGVGRGGGANCGVGRVLVVGFWGGGCECGMMQVRKGGGELKCTVELRLQ